MAIAGEYDFEPLANGVGYFGSASNTLSVGIFQWVYRTDGHGLKKSKAIYRVKGPASKWQEINERARKICEMLNTDYGKRLFNEGSLLSKKSETI